MSLRCDVSTDGKTKCGSQSHCVVRPTKGDGDRVICFDHQQRLRRGEPVFTRRGALFFLPTSSRVFARIMRGG